MAVSPKNPYADFFVSPGRTLTGVLTDRNTGLARILLTTGVATAAQRWPAVNPGLGTPGDAGSVWLAFMAPEDFYIIWGTAAVPAPLTTAHTGATPTQQAKRIPANFEYMRKVTENDYFRLIQVTGSDLLVDIEMVSTPQFGL